MYLHGSIKKEFNMTTIITEGDKSHCGAIKRTLTLHLI